jgi:hypothetical protein
MMWWRSRFEDGAVIAFGPTTAATNGAHRQRVW